MRSDGLDRRDIEPSPGVVVMRSSQLDPLFGCSDRWVYRASSGDGSLEPAAGELRERYTIGLGSLASMLADLLGQIVDDAGSLHRARVELGSPAELPGHRAHLHKLRHTYVTRLAAAGVETLTIRDLAGHTRIETTMRYMHGLPGAGSRAVAALESFDQEQSRSEVDPSISESAS